MAGSQPLDVESPQALFEVYPVLATRRAAYDTMIWQVPALAVAAQAFLLTIVLGGTATWLARMAAALLAVLLGVMAIQLLSKHRALEVADCKMMEHMEQLLGVDRLLGVAPHAKGGLRFEWAGSRHPWWVRASSVRLWIVGLVGFALVDLTLLFLVVMAPRLIGV